MKGKTRKNINDPRFFIPEVNRIRLVNPDPLIDLSMLIGIAASKQYRIEIFDEQDPVFPLLDNWIELSLALARAFEEGRSAQGRLNPGSEELPDRYRPVVPISEAPTAIKRNWRDEEEIPFAPYTGNDEFTPWSLHRTIHFQSEILRNEKTAEFFASCAEIGANVKADKGRLPKSLTWALGKTPKVRFVRPDLQAPKGKRNRRRHRNHRNRGPKHSQQS